MSRANAASDVPNCCSRLVSCGALVAVMIPAADIGERRLDADVRLDQARDLLQAAAELAAVLRAVGGRVRALVDRLDHLDRVEGLLALRLQLAHPASSRTCCSRMLAASWLRTWNCSQVVDRDRRRGCRAACAAAACRSRSRAAATSAGAAGGSARFSQPSSLVVPGVPDSMKSCASKCERVGSGEPVASTIASCRLSQKGFSGCSDGMQREAAVEIDARRSGLPGCGTAMRRTQLVVPLLEERHDDVQAVGGAALEDRDQDLALAACPARPRAAATGRRADAGHRDCGCAKKDRRVNMATSSGSPASAITRAARHRRRRLPCPACPSRWPPASAAKAACRGARRRRVAGSLEAEAARVDLDAGNLSGRSAVAKLIRPRMPAVVRPRLAGVRIAGRLELCRRAAGRDRRCAARARTDR